MHSYSISIKPLAYMYVIHNMLETKAWYTLRNAIDSSIVQRIFFLEIIDSCVQTYYLNFFGLQGGRGVARVWVIVHVFVLLAIGGSFLCIMTNELQINTSLIVFLSVSGVDFILLLLYMYIVFMYSSWEQ